MTTNKIIERIERAVGIPGLVALLAERLSPTDLQSVLLEVYRQRAGRRSAADVLLDYETNSFARPSATSPLRLLEWERVAFASLPPDFQPLDLSPVSPLGTNSAVALIDQNWSMATIRNVEVVSDSTNVLALEGALQRRNLLKANPKSTDAVHLAASHRLLRTQRYDNLKMLPHFIVFALCSAGRDQGNLRFELTTMLLHISFYMRAIRAFAGADVPLRVDLTDFNANAQERQTLIEEQIFDPLQAALAGVECVFDDQRSSGRDYYADLCFHIYANDAQLADGGVVNWTQKLLSSAKERCIISGIGSDRVISIFGR